MEKKMRELWIEGFKERLQEECKDSDPKVVKFIEELADFALIIGKDAAAHHELINDISGLLTLMNK